MAPAAAEKEGCESIKVLVRVRPAAQGEIEAGGITFGDDGQSIRVKALNSRLGTPGGDADGGTHSFKFDHIEQSASCQSIIFDKVGVPACDAFLDGFNAAVFAYGQTGSGKTHTMLGDLGGGSEGAGLIPRSLDRIFSRIETLRSGGCVVTCSCTHVEIYNEQVLDLMSQEAPPRTPTNGCSGGLQLRSEGAKGTVFVEGATTVEASSAEEVMGMLRQGAARRTVGETAANERSSRSHSIFSLRLAVDEPPSNGSQLVLHRESAYHLVDLAGSERQKQSMSLGIRLKEASNINRSLSALGNVIMALANGNSHVPYRDSKLTFLLRDSIGGNSKTFMVSNVSPASLSLSETLSTLKFSSFAKQSKLIARRNVTAADSSVGQLQEEVMRLRSLLEVPSGGGRQSDVGGGNWLRTPGGDAECDMLERGSERRLGLLRQALDREEGLRDRLAKERARYRTRLEEYDNVCRNLSKCLEDAKGHIRGGVAEHGVESAEVVQLRIQVAQLEEELEEARGHGRESEKMGMEVQLAALSEEIRMLIKGGDSRGSSPKERGGGEERQRFEEEVCSLRGERDAAVLERDAVVCERDAAVSERDEAVERIVELERCKAELGERVAEMKQAETDMCSTVDELSVQAGDAERERGAAREAEERLMTENAKLKEEVESLRMELEKGAGGKGGGGEASRLICLLKERDDEVMELQGALCERDAEIKRSNAAWDAEIRRSGAALGERDAEIGSVKSVLGEMDADNARLSGLLTDIDAECTRLTGLLGERDAECERLSHVLSVAKSEVAVKCAEVAHLSGLPHGGGGGEMVTVGTGGEEGEAVLKERAAAVDGELERVKALADALEAQRDALVGAMQVLSPSKKPTVEVQGGRVRVALQDAGTRSNSVETHNVNTSPSKASSTSSPLPAARELMSGHKILEGPNSNPAKGAPGGAPGGESAAPGRYSVSPVKGAHKAFNSIINTTQRLLDEISMGRASASALPPPPTRAGGDQ